MLTCIRLHMTDEENTMGKWHFAKTRVLACMHDHIICGCNNDCVRLWYIVGENGYFPQPSESVYYAVNVCLKYIFCLEQEILLSFCYISLLGTIKTWLYANKICTWNRRGSRLCLINREKYVIQTKRLVVYIYDRHIEGTWLHTPLVSEHGVFYYEL